MTDTSPLQPIVLHGSTISYFTGKMENYFRVRDIPYELHSMQFPGDRKKLEKALGLMQMPALQLADGRWMTDTTKIIQWFEASYPQNGLVPDDPVQRFVCLLLEDWADEWWWRPAMHYRWHYPEGAHFASRHLAAELMPQVPVPGAIKRLMLRTRQRAGYTTGDGITAESVAGVETMFLRLLGQLQAIFSDRPFVCFWRPPLTRGYRPVRALFSAFRPGSGASGDHPATGTRGTGVGGAAVEYPHGSMHRRMAAGHPR